MACIYCGANKNLSDSDIIPDYMTNGKILNPNVCKIEHNSKFSDAFESYVFSKLSFILNCLDIKSSKAKDYPKYDTKFSIGDQTYTVKNVTNELDVFNRDVLRSEDGISFWGNPEKLKEIAKSKGSNPNEVRYIDINGKELHFNNTLHYEVFFEQQMLRLVAKIAFEWYCLRNDVSGCHKDFETIVDFIVGRVVNPAVSDNLKYPLVRIVTDKAVLKELDEVEDDGGHILIAYIDRDGGISALVDVLSVCVYDVKICDHIPDFCTNNMLVQHIAIDGSGNRKEDCLCKSDYNGLPDIFAEYVFGENAVERYEEVGSFQIGLCKVPEKSKSRIMNLSTMTMKMCNSFSKGIEGVLSPDKLVAERVFERLGDLLQKNSLHPKALARFVNEHDTSENLRLYPKATHNKDTFLYYVLYKIGDRGIETINYDMLKDVLKEFKGSDNEIVVNLDVTQKLIDEMLSDSDYSAKISKGAQTVVNWKE